MLHAQRGGDGVSDEVAASKCNRICASGISSNVSAGSPVKRLRRIVTGEYQAVAVSVCAGRPWGAFAVGEVGDGCRVGGFKADVLAAVPEIARVLAAYTACAVTEFEGGRIRRQQQPLSGGEDVAGRERKVDAVGEGDICEVYGICSSVQQLDELEHVCVDKSGIDLSLAGVCGMVMEFADDGVRRVCQIDGAGRCRLGCRGYGGLFG